MKAIVFVMSLLWLTPSTHVDAVSFTSDCSPKKGHYFIDQTSSEEESTFTSFSEAFDFISQCGVSGAVVLEVAAGSGPYVESLDIYPISGNDKYNPIIIKGNFQKIQAPEGMTKPYSIKLNGDIYIEVEDLVIR